MDPSNEASNQKTYSKIFYFLVKIKQARSVTISVCLLKACRQVEGTFLNILTKSCYITCSYLILTFPKHFTPVWEHYSTLGCKPGQTQIMLRNLPGQPREQVKIMWGYKKHSSIIRLFRAILIFQSLKSNAASSTITEINHRAQTSLCEQYRNIFGSNVLPPPFPIQPERRRDGHQGTKHFSATWLTATRNASPEGTFLQNCTYAPRWV